MEDERKRLSPSNSRAAGAGAAIPTEEWLKLTYEVNYRQAWQIRHVGPGIRVAPYVMQAVTDSQGADGKALSPDP